LTLNLNLKNTKFRTLPAVPSTFNISFTFKVYLRGNTEHALLHVAWLPINPPTLNLLLCALEHPTEDS